MPSIPSAMRSAVESRVNTLPMKATFPIVWSDGPSYEPSADKPYIRATWMPSITRRLFLGSTAPHQRLSLLQLDLMAKKTWDGKQAGEVAGQIASHFPADLRMASEGVTCRVVAEPHVAGAIPDKAFVLVPVTIQIEAFA